MRMRVRTSNCKGGRGSLVCVGQEMEHLEAGSFLFPLNAFGWRDIAVVGLPGWQSVSSAGTEAGKKQFAGGFHYNSRYGNSSSLCRSRFIFWWVRATVHTNSLRRMADSYGVL